jgi:hypothetical protein
MLLLLAVVVMVLTAGICVCYAIWAHHREEMRRLYLREQELQGMFLLNDKALDKGLRSQFALDEREARVAREFLDHLR